jgi:hypothetical protein
MLYLKCRKQIFASRMHSITGAELPSNSTFLPSLTRQFLRGPRFIKLLCAVPWKLYVCVACFNSPLLALPCLLPRIERADNSFEAINHCVGLIRMHLRTPSMLCSAAINTANFKGEYFPGIRACICHSRGQSTEI